jgi:cytochrome c553
LLTFCAGVLLAVSTGTQAQAPPAPVAPASAVAATLSSGIAPTANIPPANVSICFSCHGADGNPIARDYPILKGQQRDYLVATLNAYRASQRATTPNALVMSAMAKNLSDAEIAEAADWFAMVRR